MEKKEKVTDLIEHSSSVSINYIATLFIIKSYFLLISGIMIMLAHLDKFNYRHHIEILFSIFQLSYYIIIMFGIALLFKIVLMSARFIRDRKKGRIR